MSTSGRRAARRRVARAGPGAPRQARGLRRIREGIAELGGAPRPRRRPATGTLYITILSDPGGVPDAPALAAALRRELPAAPSAVSIPNSAGR